MSDIAPNIVSKPRRFPWAVYWVLLALIALIAFLPVFSFFSSFFFIDLWHCDLNLSVSSTCEGGPPDAAYWVQFLSYSFLYVFLTWPVAIVLFIIWLVVFLIHNGRFNRRKKPA